MRLLTSVDTEVPVLTPRVPLLVLAQLDTMSGIVGSVGITTSVTLVVWATRSVWYREIWELVRTLMVVTDVRVLQGPTQPQGTISV